MKNNENKENNRLINTASFDVYVVVIIREQHNIEKSNQNCIEAMPRLLIGKNKANSVLLISKKLLTMLTQVCSGTSSQTKAAVIISIKPLKAFVSI